MQGSTSPSVRTRLEVQGRPASIDAAQVRAMKAQGLGASEIASCAESAVGDFDTLPSH
jgi:hypothetical protein